MEQLVFGSYARRRRTPLSDPYPLLKQLSMPCFSRQTAALSYLMHSTSD
jgi:hypothetical protein